VRTFRLDRVEAVQVLDEPAAPPEDLAPRDVVPGVYRGDPEDLLVTLELAPSAAWVAESIPAEQVQARADGTTQMVLRVADPVWLHRLVWREGGAVRVVHPPAAVAAVREGAAAALRGHASEHGR
jgi:proteasome accessory factor C